MAISGLERNTASLDHEHRAALCLVLTVCGAYPSLPHPGGDRVPSQHFVPHIFFGLATFSSAQ
jgi:hypothetical protein